MASKGAKSSVDIAENQVKPWKTMKNREKSGLWRPPKLMFTKAWSFFKLLDLDSGGAVEIEEFLMGCLRLRGSARAIDIAKLIHDQAWLLKNQSHFWTFVEAQELHADRR